MEDFASQDDLFIIGSSLAYHFLFCYSNSELFLFRFKEYLNILLSKDSNIMCGEHTRRQQKWNKVK